MTQNKVENIYPLTDLAIELECFETPIWAAQAILRAEILTRVVIDPCTGPGVLARAALQAGYVVVATDVCDWGLVEDEKNLRARHGAAYDFLGDYPCHVEGNTVFMNPPFSVACQFVDKAKELGARKIVVFQRWAWREAGRRRAWWDANPPSRVYLCGDRATCWRADIPEEKRTGGTPTAHAFFVWEAGQPAGPLVGTIWKK